uniref:Uncharacterized protein n=1 Tax=Rousettus aegyptiacus TaxID=9407 RepID=A0A7J8CIU0_ROUAE|nr:hypothetical protein HJG63_009251 [Rousettus aegyptiacus]
MRLGRCRGPVGRDSGLHPGEGWGMGYCPSVRSSFPSRRADAMLSVHQPGGRRLPYPFGSLRPRHSQHTGPQVASSGFFTQTADLQTFLKGLQTPDKQHLPPRAPHLLLSSPQLGTSSRSLGSRLGLS